MEEYEKVKILGEGTYGKCYLVENKQQMELSVLKQIEIFGMSDAEINDVMKEATILASLDHPYIVKFRGCITSKEGYLNILMDYAGGGDLNQKIQAAKGVYFGEEQILSWFTQICLALKHVHDRKIIHRDLKSQNIFLTSEDQVKLGDFGIARPLQLTLQKIKSVVGTPYYMSPEICQNKQYSFKTDIWSLGVILLEMCTLKPPFDANSLPALALKIARGDYLPVPKVFSKELRKIVADLLQVDPNKRPNIQQIFKYPIVKAKVDLLLSKETKQKQFSHTILHSNSQISEKPIPVAISKQLFLEILPSEHPHSLENYHSPKNINYSNINQALMLNKNNDLPKRMNDNYIKDSSKINLLHQNKKIKKPEFKRRESSEPNLTPKNHTKIENEKKILSKNGSCIQLEKKKSSNKEMNFKKKSSKYSHQEIQKNLELIRNMNNDIVVSMKRVEDLSNREEELVNQFDEEDFDKIDEHSDEEMEEDSNWMGQKLSEEEGETQRQTLENLIIDKLGEDTFNKFYLKSQQAGGFAFQETTVHAGLLCLLYGMHHFQLKDDRLAH